MGNPSLTITPSATNIDASQPLTVTVSAAGTTSLGTPTGTVTLAGGGYSSMAQFLNRGSYVFTLNPGALNVSSDTLTATYTGDPNYAPAMASVTISVTGPSLSISTSSLNFPTTVIGTSSATLSATLKNVGTALLTISGFSIEDPNDGYQQTNTCTAPLAIGGSCTLTVTFAPILQESSPVELLINDNAANSPQVITLNGVSIPPSPAVTFSYTSVSFPNTAPGVSSAPQVLTLTNSGGATLAVSTVTVSGSNPSSFMESSNCANVAVNANCQISVTFTPSNAEYLCLGPKQLNSRCRSAQQSAARNTFSATLTVVNNASPSSQSVALSGTAAEIGTYTLSGSKVTVAPGSSGSSTISATVAGGYSGTITLASCSESNSPAGAIDIPTCTITNSTLTVGASNSTGLVTISAAAPQTNLRLANSKSNSTMKTAAGAGSLLIAGVFIFGISPRSHRVLRLLAIILCLAAFTLCSGCGGNGSSNGTSNNPGTTPGSYTFTVTGTDGAAVKQTATIAVTVN
jgi:Bacterial Ig-like domain (group 3)